MAPSKRSTSAASKTPPTKKLRRDPSVLDYTSSSGDSDNEEYVLVEDEDENTDEEQPLGGPIPSIFTYALTYYPVAH
jgi:hypothetical protein